MAAWLSLKTMTGQSKFDPMLISAALLKARRTVQVLHGFPGTLPSTLDAAYRVQHQSIKDWDDKLVGFKVGGIGPNFRKTYPSDWLKGPIFARNIYHVTDGGEVDVRVFKDGFAAYEAEFIFALSGLTFLKEPVATIDEAYDFISAIYLGAEIASSPMPMVNALGPGSIISDFGNNAGMVIGPQIAMESFADISEIDVTLTIDGIPTGQARANAGEAGPFGALRFLLNHLLECKDELELPDSIYLSSSAITGVHQSKAGTQCVMQYEGFGGFTLNMVPQKPISV